MAKYGKRPGIPGPVKKRWSELVIQAISDKGETYMAFGARFNVSGQAVQQWAAQGTLPSSENKRKMAKFLGWTLEQLEHYLETGDRVSPDYFDIDTIKGQLNQQPTGKLIDVVTAAMTILSARTTG